MPTYTFSAPSSMAYSVHQVQVCSFMRLGGSWMTTSPPCRQWSGRAAAPVRAPGPARVRCRDRAGLERLLRYCARPIFAGERLAWAEAGERLVYSLPKPGPFGQTVFSLTPMEFLERLARLIPPPPRHRHRYHGVLAPNAPWRAAVTARAGLPPGEAALGAPPCA
jgi:Putative transposase.